MYVGAGFSWPFEALAGPSRLQPARSTINVIVERRPGGRRNRSITEPTRTSSPSSNATVVAIRSPRTYVPFLLPRSSIVAFVDVTEMRAWRRDTDGESIDMPSRTSLPRMFSPDWSGILRPSTINQHSDVGIADDEPSGASTRSAQNA